MQHGKKDPEVIIRKYCEALPNDVARIATLLEESLQGIRPPGQVLGDLFEEFHRMSGTALCMGFPFLGKELGKIELEIEQALHSPDANWQTLFREVARKIESIARLLNYVSPENSILLRHAEMKYATLHNSRSLRSERFRKIMGEQRVIFADDDLSVRRLMRDMLASIGVGATEFAENGEALLDIAPGFAPSMIITDWYMQPMNGLEFLKRVRGGETEIEQGCPIIFLSSQKTIDQVQQVVGEGADHFLVKPFTLNLVEKAIYQVATRPRARQSVYYAW
ncbi:response regulator [Ponticaulis profundi]|uniref:Response regulator n=1 Tax=Ponticaulis profundi TaxID=2665222 RepID=A0ABW1S8W8_9PROT